MKCKNCGEEIPEGYVYCKCCGTEVQLVPDYNLLDEDILSGIIQKEANAAQNAGELGEEKREKRRKSRFIWGGICVVLLIAVLTLFFLYRHIQEKNANSYAYQYHTAEEYIAKKDYGNARRYLERALELKPGDADARNRLLELYLAGHEEEAAVSLLEEMISEDKSDKQAVRTLIGLYDEREEYDKILELCETVKSGRMLDLFEDYLVDQPKFSKISGTYGKPIKISILAEQGYDVFYSTDGSEPDEHGKPYRESISLEQEGTTQIKAVTRNEKGIYSQIVTATYTIRYEAPDMPNVTPAGGTYSEPQMIHVSVPEDCTAYYTWDGSDPTRESARYTGTLEMPQGNHVLSVILVNSSGLESCIYRMNYIYMP